MYKCIYLFIFMFVYICIYICIYRCIYIHVYVYVYICIHIYIYMPIRIFKYINTFCANFCHNMFVWRGVVSHHHHTHTHTHTTSYTHTTPLFSPVPPHTLLHVQSPTTPASEEGAAFYGASSDYLLSGYLVIPCVNVYVFVGTQLSATQCSTLQHAATHCNTRQCLCVSSFSF